jgi:hypothetical protein
VNAEREWTLLEVDIAVRGRSPEADVAVEWFWRNGPFVERYTDFVRHARKWCERPEARSLFERLRPPPPVRKEGLFPSLMDWLALSSALGTPADVLAWFDERVAEGDTPLPPMHRLRRVLLERGRLRDWLAFAEPLQSTVEALESVATCRETFAEHPEVLESELDELDCEVALWRRVAELERPDQVAELDAAIAASERAESVRAWLARPPVELTQALIRHCLD